MIFIDWYLPGYRSGGPTRSCANLIEHLNEDVEFSVITRDTDYMSSVPYSGIKYGAWNTLADGTPVWYLSSSELSKKSIYSLLEHEKYDQVYLNGIFSKYFTLIPLQYFRRKKNMSVIVASRGMLAESALAIKKWKKLFFLFFAKQVSLFKNVTFHATNEEEAISVRNVFGKRAKVHIAPNLSEISSQEEWKRRTPTPGLLKLVCVARVAPEKNIKFALEVLTRTKANVQFDIYGPVYDEKYMKECKEVVRRMPANVRVSFMNSIDSALVTRTIANYDFLFLPTQGENFGHVILQSLSVGVPVIISDKTLWKDLEAKKAGWELPLSNQAPFMDLIGRCAKMGEEEYVRFSKGAFDHARAHMSNKESLEQNRRLFVK